MLNYKTVNGYQIPDLKIPDGQATLGRYGRMRKAYLKEHRKMTFNSLLLTGELTAHRDPMAWVGAMNSLKAQAEEIVLSELVYA